MLSSTSFFLFTKKKNIARVPTCVFSLVIHGCVSVDVPEVSQGSAENNETSQCQFHSALIADSIFFVQ